MQQMMIWKLKRLTMFYKSPVIISVFVVGTIDHVIPFIMRNLKLNFITCKIRKKCIWQYLESIIYRIKLTSIVYLYFILITLQNSCFVISILIGILCPSSPCNKKGSVQSKICFKLSSYIYMFINLQIYF